jgi:U3 small nucleolar ribonucleoprotein protein IMP3
VCRYNKLSREVRNVARKISSLEEKDPMRAEATDRLLAKLHDMGLVPTRRGLALADKVSTVLFA